MGFVAPLGNRRSELGREISLDVAPRIGVVNSVADRHESQPVENVVQRGLSGEVLARELELVARAQPDSGQSGCIDRIVDRPVSAAVVDDVSIECQRPGKGQGIAQVKQGAQLPALWHGHAP